MEKKKHNLKYKNIKYIKAQKYKIHVMSDTVGDKRNLTRIEANIGVLIIHQNESEFSIISQHLKKKKKRHTNVMYTFLQFLHYVLIFK